MEPEIVIFQRKIARIEKLYSLYIMILQDNILIYVIVDRIVSKRVVFLINSNSVLR